MAATLSELEDRVNRLNQRIALLATTEQVNVLQALVSGWKTDSDDTMNVFQSTMDTLEQRVNDHETRILALESP